MYNKVDVMREKPVEGLRATAVTGFCIIYRQEIQLSVHEVKIIVGAREERIEDGCNDKES